MKLDIYKLIITIFSLVFGTCFVFLLGRNKGITESLDSANYDYIIDVRTIEEWNKGHHYNAIHIPLSLIKQGEVAFRNGNNGARDSKILVHCRTGRRANLAADLLRNYGYTRITTFNGTYHNIT